MTSSNSDQQNERLADAQQQRVRIVAPHHPLNGHSLPVLRRVRKSGEPHVVVGLPSGQSQLIPLRWTDALPLSVAPACPIFSVTSIRAGCVRTQNQWWARAPSSDILLVL